MNDTKAPRDGLEKLLHAWADSRAADDEQLQQLHCRVLDAVLSDVEAESQPQTQVNPSRASRSRAGWLLAGTAASLLLATCALQFGEPSPRVAASGPPRAAWWDARDLRHRALVAAQLSASYGNRLRWFAEANDQLEIVLGEDESSASTDHALALRLVVERRKPGTTAWSSLSQLDIVSRGENVMEIPAAVAGLALRVWAYRLPDGMIFVDSAIDLSGENGQRSVSSRLLQSGRPCEVGTSQNHEWEYRVFQTAVELPAPG